VGSASWYGNPYLGRTTATGERFSRQQSTTSHRSLPRGTKVKVTNLRTKQRVVVRINDRGLNAGGTCGITDLSEADHPLVNSSRRMPHTERDVAAGPPTGVSPRR
jgi:rare lipoprotein A